MMMTNDMEIYVHIPFCVRKCDYCDFCSYAGAEDKIRPYFLRLKEEIKEKAARFKGSRPVTSVFFGGGTPTLPDSFFICDTLETLRAEFEIKPDAEITIEANPNSAALSKFAAYRDAGFNRLSIGLQSALETELKILSRIHSYEDFLKTFEDARKAGLHNINTDIMTGIPGQTCESLKETLSRVIALGPQHISAYSLIIEEGTPFFERYGTGSGLPAEEEDREMYHETGRMLAEAGYRRYEISNYALPGHECRHNTGYWTRKPYLGFGIAAASLFDEIRYQKHRDLDGYIAGDLSEEKEPVDRNGQMEEFMFLGLRMTEGVSFTGFEEFFGSSLEEEFPGTVDKLRSEGLVDVRDGRVMLTQKGLDLENYVTGHFVK